ncbi:MULTISPECIES: RseA family anti-sigma factor [Luteimonas]|uniref:Anti sigma-E protein RseA N-terminal domain-containing protein n=1 Tax=Luteimonas chenhongjianii TaxID=2006110 RepID=A0A290XFL9_9GAMM|nr:MULTISPECIES: RseA family anti-sigma factor [Luteimonas]ATD67861.1 hypothetical protein CNR27_10835 [Luteimonas chenhongjianii]RPD88475.1 hypothetical protein EGK76_04805 [Luteimonas sp. 100069]
MNTVDDIEILQPGPDPDKLERFHRQQLSAMLDAELSHDQARFLRRRLEHDAELSGCFERWQVCGDVLRGRHVSLLPPDFAERVARGIATDGTVSVVIADARRPRLLRWGGGAALVASVALVALFVGRPGAVDAPVTATPAVANAAPVTPAPVAVDAIADASMQVADLQESAPAAVAAAAPRGATERASRGQSQRAAVRVGQGLQPAETRAVASSPATRAGEGAGAHAGVGVAMAMAGAAAAEPGFSDVPAVARPWPRASSLSANSSFSVRQGERFAAPSWDARETQTSTVLPRFPVDPADAASVPGASQMLP